MKFVNFNLFILSFALAFNFLIVGCKGNEKGPPNPHWSQSIDESKENNVFEFEVKQCSPSLIFDSTQKLIIKSAWIEYGHQIQVYVVGKTSLEKSGSHQLILIYETIKDSSQLSSKWHYFIAWKPSSDTCIHFFINRTDTIKIPLYRSESPTLPHKKERKAYDSLIFIRK